MDSQAKGSVYPDLYPADVEEVDELGVVALHLPEGDRNRRVRREVPDRLEVVQRERRLAEEDPCNTPATRHKSAESEERASELRTPATCHKSAEIEERASELRDSSRIAGVHRAPSTASGSPAPALRPTKCTVEGQRNFGERQRKAVKGQRKAVKGQRKAVKGSERSTKGSERSTKGSERQ